MSNIDVFGPLGKRRGLPEKCHRVLEDHMVDGFGMVPACSEFQSGDGYGKGVGGAPVAGRVHPEPLGTARFQNVGRPFGGALGVGIERHAAPESTVQDFLHGVFFNVVDQHSTGIDGRLVPYRFHDQPGSFLFVFEVWGVHEDERLVLGRDLEVFFQDAKFVFRVLVEPNLSDPQNVVFGQEIENDLDRRDFTINAMAIEISEKLIGNDEPGGKLLDFWKGLGDLEDGVLRAVGDAGERLGEDGLRVIRAFRFLESGEERLRDLDPDLSNAISSNLEMLEMVSKERIWNELGKILRGYHSKEIVEKMHSHGVLEKIISGVSVNLEVRHSRDHMVNLALICSSETSNGSELSEKLAGDLRLSRKEVSTLSLLHGLRGLELDNSIKSVRRFMAIHPDQSIRRMILDYLSGSGVEIEQFETCYLSAEELRAGNSPLIDGNLLSSLTGIEPGRKLGRLKDWLHRIQVENDIENRESLISMMYEIPWEEAVFEDWPVLSWP